MATTKKLSQQELRQLMREKAAQKSAVVGRIESPLARYDDKDNLFCVVCNVNIHAEALWSAHLLEKAHKKKIEELKQLKQPKPPRLTSSQKSANGLKRARGDDSDLKATKKVSKFETISEFSKKEIQIRQNKADKHKEDTEEDDVDEDGQSHGGNLDGDTTSSVADPSLPQDFFDNGVQPVIATDSSVKRSNDRSSKQGTSHNSAKEENDNDNPLPKGFFDDPKLDAKSRKGPHAKDPFEEQMELFRKEIAQESIVSEVILEEEIEQLQKEKDLEEIEEQMAKWERVDAYQKRIEEIHKRRKEEKPAVESRQSSDDDEDDEDQESLNMDFWRSKGAFL